MSSGLGGSSRLSFLANGPASESNVAGSVVDHERLQTAIGRTVDWLLQRQHADGHWVAELEGDTILESEYILLLAFLGQGQSTHAKECAAYILSKQCDHGGWAIYPGGPLEVSASVKAYLALKITEHDPQSEAMIRARDAIVMAGGVERVNSFTRYYLAMLGLIPYELCPAVPPELILLPRWAPFNIYEMSAWSRTIIVPLSLLWAYQPVTKLPAECGLEELYASPEKRLPRTFGGVNQEGTARLDQLDELLSARRSRDQVVRSPRLEAAATPGRGPMRAMDPCSLGEQRRPGRNLSPHHLDDHRPALAGLRGRLARHPVATARTR